MARAPPDFGTEVARANDPDRCCECRAPLTYAVGGTLDCTPVQPNEALPK